MRSRSWIINPSFRTSCNTRSNWRSELRFRICLTSPSAGLPPSAKFRQSPIEGSPHRGVGVPLPKQGRWATVSLAFLCD